MSLDLVAYGIVAPWRLDFPADVMGVLADWDAFIDLDAYLWAPAGTEEGPACRHCKLERPSSADDSRIASLSSPGPAHGAADARLIVRDVSRADGEALCDAVRLPSEYLAVQRTFVVTARPGPMAGKRRGAVGLAELLRGLRASPDVSKLIVKATSTRNVEVSCWASYFNVGLRVMRRDIRRLTKLSASVSLVLESAALPAFHDGQCYHCEYVLPGFTAGIAGGCAAPRPRDTQAARGAA